MISRQQLEQQMKRINFHFRGWGRTEVGELCNILMPQEEIEECVNGYYEAGFALLVSTKDRVLLVDKKPLGYLTVHDMRFDMINELDLHHRWFGAQIRISCAGNKELIFSSSNQARLRRLLNYVQSRMIQIKKDVELRQSQQKQHLEEMNEQLRLYLLEAHKQQYINQANAYRSGVTDYSPAAAVPAVISIPQGSIPLPPVQPNYQPDNQFEQVASAAFDRQMQFAAGPVYPTPGTEADSLTIQEVGLNAARRVLPVISAYTRLPLMNQRRHLQTSPKL